ncbi:MAG: hypothetical protein U1E76_05550 [Planctomycetota bacterium]
MTSPRAGEPARPRAHAIPLVALLAPAVLVRMQAVDEWSLDLEPRPNTR